MPNQHIFLKACSLENQQPLLTIFGGQKPPKIRPLPAIFGGFSPKKITENKPLFLAATCMPPKIANFLRLLPWPLKIRPYFRRPLSSHRKPYNLIFGGLDFARRK
jgi:hypothetical protein